MKFINSKGIKIITYRCLSASVAFKSILKEKPKLVLMTSGTLPPKKEAENIIGANFDIFKQFRLPN